MQADSDKEGTPTRFPPNTFEQYKRAGLWSSHISHRAHGTRETEHQSESNACAYIFLFTQIFVILLDIFSIPILFLCNTIFTNIVAEVI